MKDLTRNLSVLKALIIRNLMARYGRKNLGFIWTFLEPMIVCTGVMFLWTVIHNPTIHGLPVVAFVLTGYMPLTLWRHITLPLVGILRGNLNLLYHRPVSPGHIILARLILEFLSTTAALAIIYFVVATIGVVEPIADPGLALAGWLLTAWYFGATGVALSALSEYWEPSEKFMGPAQYLQLPISGVFFMVDWMPDYAKKLLLLNPAVHCFEMFRAGFFGEGFTTHYDPAYLAAWSIAVTMIAGAAMYHVRDRIEMS